MGAFKVVKYGGTWRITEAGWEYVVPCNVPEPERFDPNLEMPSMPAREACAFECGHDGPHSWEKADRSGTVLGDGGVS